MRKKIFRQLKNGDRIVAVLRSCTFLHCFCGWFLPYRIFYDIEIISIDDSCFAKGIFSFEVPAVVGVYMPMKEELWFIFFHQGPEDFESAVWQIFHIVDMVGRRMGD